MQVSIWRRPIAVEACEDLPIIEFEEAIDPQPSSQIQIKVLVVTLRHRPKLSRGPIKEGTREDQPASPFTPCLVVGRWMR